MIKIFKSIRLIFTLTILTALLVLPQISLSSDLLLRIVVEETNNRITVISVENNLPAGKGDIRKDDIVKKIDGKDVNNLENFVKYLELIKNKDNVNISVKRGPAIFDVPIKTSDVLINVSLNDSELYPMKRTSILKADIFCRDGLLFMNKGLKNEAFSKFGMAIDSYKEALDNKDLPKEELIAISDNLKKMNQYINIDTDKLDKKKEGIVDKKVSSVNTVKVLTNKKKHEPAKVKKQVVEKKQMKPVQLPKLKPTTKSFTEKMDLRKAGKGDFWLIEWTTMLLEDPELYVNEGKLLGNLIGGISAGTVVEVSEIKDLGPVNRWLKVRVYNSNGEVYTNGWILSDTISKAKNIPQGTLPVHINK